MPKSGLPLSLLVQLRSCALLALVFCGSVLAQNTSPWEGHWLINEQLSDNTDKKVAAALRAAGEKIKSSFFDRRKDKYRGGPADQELYDRLSYDNELQIELRDEHYLFTYADDFSRWVYTDNRSRSISLNALENAKDFSLGHLDNGKLLVEAHPRDGGFAEETYSLSDNNTRLRVVLYIKPRTFSTPIELTRVYDRQP